ncbi:MAG: outer membrane beta-barrel protein [Bacteroidota bacterium]
MKKTLYTGLALISFLLSSSLNAQEHKTEEQDTTRINLGETELLIINKKGKSDLDKTTALDTIDASDKDDEDDNDKNEGHWGGIDFGATMLLNSAMKASFPNDKFLENDPAKSFYWNLNVMDHKFNIYKHYVGITTGFGVNFTQIGIKNDNLLLDNVDSLWTVQDTINHYSKNKLRATYLQIPLLLEFNTNEDEDKSFYVAAGVIGGVRVGSALIQKIERDDFDNKQKLKGTYGLNPFKLDATFKMGYGDWGVFANYALLPLFDTDKTSEAYPLTFGLSMNF